MVSKQSSTKNDEEAVLVPSGDFNPKISIDLHPDAFRAFAYLSFYAMVILAAFVTSKGVTDKDGNPVDLDHSLLVQTFGFNNICVEWDYTPSRQITALFYPMFEYSFAGFLVLSYFYVKKCYLMHEIPKWLWRFEQITFPIKLVLGAWFRMIFVYSVEESVVGHTLGFLGLQVVLVLVALENVLLANARKEDYFRIGRKATQVLTWTYFFILLPATLLKLIVDISFLMKKPIVNIQDPIQVIFVHSLDKIWMIFAAVLPFFFAIYQYKTEPHLKVRIQ